MQSANFINLRKMDNLRTGFNTCSFLLAFLVLVAVTVRPALATELTWVGNTDASWETAANWDTNTAPIGGDSLVFGAAGSSGTTLTYSSTAHINFSGITFNSEAPSYTVSNAWTRLTGDIVNNSTNAQTLNLGHQLDASVTFNAAAGDLNFLANNSINIQTYTLTVTGAHDTTISLPIGGSTGNLTKTGTGKLTLSGKNSYTGTLTLDGGSLVFGNHDTFGNAASTPAVTVVAGAGSTIYSNGKFTTFGALNLNNATMVDNGGDGSWKAFQLKGTVSVTGNSAITMADTINTNHGVNLHNTTFDIAQNGNLTVSTILCNGYNNTANGNFTKSGAGTLTLSGANTYTGTTTITGGTLELTGSAATNANNSSYSVGANTTLIFGTAANIGGANKITGLGTVKIAANSSLTFVNHDTFGNAASTPMVTVVAEAGSTIYSNGLFTTFGALNLNNATMVDNGGNATWKAFQLKGTVSVTGNSAITMDTGSNHGVNLYNTTFDIAQNSTLTVSSPLISSAAYASSGKFTKTGNGTLTLSATNTYTGGTTVSAGTLKLTGAGTLGSGPLALNGNAILDISEKTDSLSFSDLTLNSGNTLKVTIDKGEDGNLTCPDRLDLGTGNFDAAGTLSIFLTGELLGLEDLGKVADVIDFGSFKGTFDSVVIDPDSLNKLGGDFFFTYNAEMGEVQLAIPEPSTWLLLILGATGLLLFRRRK